MLLRRVERRSEQPELATIVDAGTLRAMQAVVETVTVDADVRRYCVDLVTATRTHPNVQLGASPRGALALLLCARAQAVIAGRDFVTPDDVKSVAPSVMAHRITIKPELWLTDVSGAAVTTEVLASVPTPTAGGGGGG
jgi:MoxR-like ATPase